MSQTTPPPQMDEAIGYTYFISYVFSTHDAPAVERHGNRWIGMKMPITTYEQVRRLQDRTLADHADQNWRTVTIINWMFLDRELLEFSPAVAPTPR